jgi:hypothetical protein
VQIIIIIYRDKVSACSLRMRGIIIMVHVSVFVRMRSHTEVQQRARGGCGVLGSSLKSRKAASQPLQDDELGRCLY